MPTIDEYASQPREARMRRLSRTADELGAALTGQEEGMLCRRPDAKNWAAKEVVCHLRDTEEVFGARVEQILAMDVDPTLIVTNADRMAEDRQYLRNDVTAALTAFRRLRGETLETFGRLTASQWDKGAVHPALGRITIDRVLSIMAFHDDTHLDQLTRALRGQV
jgi:DinB superfamily